MARDSTDTQRVGSADSDIGSCRCPTRPLFLTATLAGGLLPARLAAQSAPARVGWLTAQRAAGAALFLEGLRSGLASRGYVEGSNLILEARFADDAVDRLPGLAAELIGARVALIVAQGQAVPVIAKLN